MSADVCSWICSQQKRPLPPQSALSDVSSDHALKTVTIEPFPHSSSLSIASVHPCKHSNVMKRFIERMDRGVRELQQKEKQHPQHGSTASSSASSSQPDDGTSTTSGKKEKSRWFGKSSTSSKKDKSTEVQEGDELVEGLRVDQYLVVFLKFMSSIGKHICFHSFAKLCSINSASAVPTIEVDSTTNIVSFTCSYELAENDTDALVPSTVIELLCRLCQATDTSCFRPFLLHPIRLPSRQLLYFARDRPRGMA